MNLSTFSKNSREANQENYSNAVEEYTTSKVVILNYSSVSIRKYQKSVLSLITSAIDRRQVHDMIELNNQGIRKLVT